MNGAASPVEALVQRVLDGGAPLALRSAAARGALPLPRTDLVRLFVRLLEDADEQVRREAAASLGALDEENRRSVLSDAECAPEVLAHFAKQATRDEGLAELIAFHRNASADCLGLLAARGSPSVIDLVLTNEERMREHPLLVERLMSNPALRADQRGKILELLERASREVEPPDASGPTASTGEDEAREAARLLEVDVGELFAASEILGGEELENAEDPRIRSAYRKILTLNGAQKALLAMKGDREERTILVRDTNKVVALAVLKNPRLTEADVEQIASMRNVSDEVLRVIGSNREWVRNYAVVVHLVRNPRTPPSIATNFVARLLGRDLKNLIRDHNASEVVRRMAKRIADLRTQQENKTLHRRRR